MRVLVVPAFLPGRGSRSLDAALSHCRLWLAIRAQWVLILRRGDRRLLTDAGATDPPEQPRGDPQALRQSYWML